MDNFKLDYSKKQTIQLSNDAFYYLHYGEELLDESNLDEANEIGGMFPYGFYIEDDWKAVEDSDMIEATFIPFAKDDDDYDEYQDLNKYVQLQIKWVDLNHVNVWWCNVRKGTRELLGCFEVYTDKYGARCFQTGDYTIGKGSLFFMSGFKKRNA